METSSSTFRMLPVLAMVAALGCRDAGADEATLRVLVIDDSRAPILDAEISIWPAGPAPVGPGPLEPAAEPLAVAASGRDGRVQLSGLDPAAPLVARVRRAGRSPRWLELAEVPASDVTIVLAPARALDATVVDLAGAPVGHARVRVTAQPDDQRGAAMSEGWTDAEGRVRFTDAPPGPLRVTAAPTDRADATREVDTDDREVVVRVGPAGAVEGRVSARRGAVGGAWVAVGPHLVRAAADGRYRIDGVAPGPVQIEAIGPRGAGLAIGSTHVTSGAIARGDLVLRRSAVASGVVLDDRTGRPLAGVRVRALRSLGDPAGMVTALVRDPALGQFETATDEQGRFRLQRVRASKLTLVADLDGYASATVPVTPGDRGAISAELRLTPRAWRTGRVVGPGGSPVPFARVAVDSTDAVVADAEGRFTVSVPPVPSVRLTAGGAGLAGSAVVAGEDGEGDIRVERAVAVRGRVVSPEGDRLGGVVVRVRRIDLEPPGPLATLATDASGAFAIADLEPGRYELALTQPGRAPRVLGPVDLTSARDLQALTLDPARTITGLVTGASGAPVSGAIVFAHGAHHDTSVTTDADGRFEIDGFAAADEVTLDAVDEQHGRARAVVSPATASPAVLLLGAIAAPPPRLGGADPATSRNGTRKENRDGRINEGESRGVERSCVHPGRSRGAIPGEGCRAVGRVLHDTPRVQARASAVAGVRERLARGCVCAAQRAGGVGISAHAGRHAAGSGRLEPCGAPGERSAGLHRGAEEGRRAVPERDGDRPRRQAGSDRGSRREPDRAVRAGSTVLVTGSRSGG